MLAMRLVVRSKLLGVTLVSAATAILGAGRVRVTQNPIEVPIPLLASSTQKALLQNPFRDRSPQRRSKAQPGSDTARLGSIWRSGREQSLFALVADQSQQREAACYGLDVRLREAGGLQTSPIEVDGVLYGITPKQKYLPLMRPRESCFGNLIRGSKARSRTAASHTGPMARRNAFWSA